MKFDVYFDLSLLQFDMLLGRLEKDGSRKVGTVCPRCLFPSLVCSVSFVFYEPYLSVSASLSLLYLGVFFSHHISYMLQHPPLSSALFHCHGSPISPESFQRFLTFLCSNLQDMMFEDSFFFCIVKFTSLCVSSR